MPNTNLSVPLIAKILSKHLERNVSVDDIDTETFYDYDDDNMVEDGYVVGAWFEEKFYGIRLDRNYNVFHVDEITL